MTTSIPGAPAEPTLAQDLEFVRAISKLEASIRENRGLLNELVGDAGRLVVELELLRQVQQAHGATLARIDAAIQRHAAPIPRRSPLPIDVAESL